jgi:hypothetical protein
MAPVIAITVAFGIVHAMLAIRWRSATMLIPVVFPLILAVAVVTATSVESSWGEGLFVAWFCSWLPMFFVALLCMQRRDVVSLRFWMQENGYELMEAHYSIRSLKAQECYVLRFLARSSEGIAKSGYAVVHHKAGRGDALDITWDTDEENKSQRS